MTQYRITDQVGPEEFKCTTEWIDEDDYEPDMVLMGLRMRGWAHTNVEWKGEP